MNSKVSFFFCLIISYSILNMVHNRIVELLKLVYERDFPFRYISKINDIFYPCEESKP